LVVLHFGVGFVEVRKDRVAASDSDAWPAADHVP
jgi:hypothetical protein